MIERKREGALTKDEKRIVKALLGKGWRNQDIQALVNIGRPATINSARITEVKKDQNQKAASDTEVSFFEIKKRSFDPKTGLNFFDDERLIRAREAMILAVQIFNSAALSFKTEMFAVLSNIAWTYLLHEHYARKGVKLEQGDGRTLLLSQMVERSDCPLSDGMKNNLRAMKTIRDDVEHKLLGKGDAKWYSLFQACCLNFDKALREFFGDRLTLANDLAFALQFARMDVEQLSTLNKYEIPPHIEAIDAGLDERLTDEQRADLEYQFRVIYTIEAIDAGLDERLTDEQRADLEYQFRVIYTLDAASKGRAHFEFFRPESAEGKEIRNVLVQYKAADHLYPHKPSHVCKIVKERTGKLFTAHTHRQAWVLLRVRPAGDAKQRENTIKEYCIFHPAHNDYTYSDKWIDRLVDEVTDDQKFTQIKAVKL